MEAAEEPGAEEREESGDNEVPESGPEALSAGSGEPEGPAEPPEPAEPEGTAPGAGEERSGAEEAAPAVTPTKKQTATITRTICHLLIPLFFIKGHPRLYILFKIYDFESINFSLLFSIFLSKSSIAFPKAIMPITFSVPALRFLSCASPWIKFRIFTSFRI